MAQASLSTSGGHTTLNSMALFSGRAQSRGAFSTSNRVVDIAIPLNQL